MAGQANKVCVTWKDRLGKVARIVFYVATTIVDPKDPVILGLLALIERISRAKATQIELSAVTAYSGTAGTQAYSTCEDKAQISMIDNNGKAHNYKIPGLKPTILDTDNETIKTGVVPVSTFITDMVTYACGPGSVLLKSTAYGKRLMRKRLKH